MYIVNKFINFIGYIADNLGTFCNRVVECCCKKKSKPRIKRNEDFIDLNNSGLERREINQGNKLATKKTRYQIVAEENTEKGIQTIEVSGRKPQEIVNNYVTDYQNHPFYGTLPRIVFRTGFIDSSGIVHRLDHNTYNRLKKTGFCFINKANNEDKIALPLMGIGEYELFDNLGWFKSNIKIQKKLKTITDAHRVMLLLLKTTYAKIERFGLKKKISEKNQANVEGIERIKNLNVRKAVQEVLPVNDTSRRGQTKLRLQRQLAVNQHTNQSESNDQKEVLQSLKHFEKLLTASSIYGDIYPNKANAYMIFENLSNNFSDILIFSGKLFKNAYLKTELFDHLQHQFQIFEESLQLLLPYTIEITKEFDIKLASDPNLNHLFVSSQKTSKSAIADLEEYQKIERELAMLMSEANETSKKQEIRKQEAEKLPLKAKTNQQPKKSEEKSKPKNKHPQDSATPEDPLAPIPQSPIEFPLSPQSPIGSAKPLEERIVTNLSPAAPETPQKIVAKKALEQSRLIARQEKNEAREQRIAERRAIQAKEIVSKHKEEQNKHKEIAQKERQNSQVKIHELPPEELVWNTILPGLGSTHASYVDMMYGQEDGHIQMSHKHVVNLAMTIKEILDENGISCGKDLFNYVISRIHHRHDSDTGDLLPRHYVDILRSCFIIFGIFPKNWKPKTEEDFDAMEKYYQRRLDYFYWESRV